MGDHNRKYLNFLSLQHISSLINKSNERLLQSLLAYDMVIYVMQFIRINVNVGRYSVCPTESHLRFIVCVLLPE